MADNPIPPIQRIAVDGETAAHLCSYSRSYFDSLVREGALPQPIRKGKGKPVWLVAGLVQAMGGILSGGSHPPTPATATQAAYGIKGEIADEEKWDCVA
jgi:predicted DNA-binding transcriptional regulator AlpA